MLLESTSQLQFVQHYNCLDASRTAYGDYESYGGPADFSMLEVSDVVGFLHNSFPFLAPLTGYAYLIMDMFYIFSVLVFK